MHRILINRLADLGGSSDRFLEDKIFMTNSIMNILLLFSFFFFNFVLINAGLMATYHADNEYCLLSDMCQGYQVFVSIISQLED